ncbi:ATP-binding cassette domain-containing protein [Streptomyces sp. NPDC091272]|uniref:ATP-binding cassette domain-containing protein n=1 Tax=Streptomyces sp. NPDC091272 TaxID=3365981 RepID=UPI0037FB5361
MLQAIGLTSTARRARRPAVDDLSFEAMPGEVTALLGAPGSGRTTALRLMLALEQGRGATYFRGRPLHRIAHPAREVGALLGDVPGHPARTARGQLRMLCAAAGVPATRADELLEIVGLTGLGNQRLGNLSLGMDRRLGLASALLADPHTLILDEPAAGLSPRDNSWLYGLLRAHAAHGGTVLCTTGDPKEAARTADRVVTLVEGRLVADQAAVDFARTRLRPRVTVRTPQALRLGALLNKEARANRHSVEVVPEGGNHLSVYGSSCAEIGDTAFRHGVLLHQLADEIGDMGPPAARIGRPANPSPVPSTEPRPHSPTVPTPTPPPSPEPVPASATSPAPSTAPATTPRPSPAPENTPRPSPAPEPASASATAPEPHPGPIPVPVPGLAVGPGQSPVSTRLPVPAPGPAADDPLPRPARSPLRPLRYELRRAFGTRSALLVLTAVLGMSAALCALLTHNGAASLTTALVAWPGLLPLPPAAFGAGLLGALAFGDEYRYPALAASRGTSPRQLGLLVAKLTVSAGTALALAGLTVCTDFLFLRLLYGAELTPLPAGLLGAAARWAALCVGCAWAGLLGAGAFRVTAAGVAAVLAVPVAVAPAVQHLLTSPAVRSMAGLPSRLRELVWLRLPGELDQWLLAAMHLVAQPVGVAMTLSLPALLCAYLFTGLRRKARW